MERLLDSGKGLRWISRVSSPWARPTRWSASARRRSWLWPAGIARRAGGGGPAAPGDRFPLHQLLPGRRAGYGRRQCDLRRRGGGHGPGLRRTRPPDPGNLHPGPSGVPGPHGIHVPPGAAADPALQGHPPHRGRDDGRTDRGDPPNPRTRAGRRTALGAALGGGARPRTGPAGWSPLVGS